MITVIFVLLNYALGIFKWAIIIAAVFSILTAFGVLDARNRLVWTIGDFLYRFTDPVLRPIRNLLPNFGGIDISPWIAVILIQVIQGVLLPKLYAAVTYGAWQGLVF
jgi:YggT family protein